MTFHWLILRTPIKIVLDKGKTKHLDHVLNSILSSLASASEYWIGSWTLRRCHQTVMQCFIQLFRIDTSNVVKCDLESPIFRESIRLPRSQNNYDKVCKELYVPACYRRERLSEKCLGGCFIVLLYIWLCIMKGWHTVRSVGEGMRIFFSVKSLVGTLSNSMTQRATRQ